MKMRILFPALLALAFTSNALAANLTVTVPTNQVARVQTAIGQKLGLKDGAGNPRDATAVEVSQYCADQLRITVREQEQANQAAAAKAAVADITATGS